MIRHEQAFREALPAQYDGVFLWDFLKGAFGPIIEPMDFDAVVERRGYFLVFETKAPGTPVPQGQQITLKAFVRKPKCTALIINGKTPATIHGFEVWTRNEIASYPDADAAALRRWCEGWFAWVESNQRLEVVT